MALPFDAILRGPEIECIKRIAKQFEGGISKLEGDDDLDAVGIAPANREQLLGMCLEFGIIVDTHLGSFTERLFLISPSVVQCARQIEKTEQEKSEGKDIVESVKTTLRKHPVGGWIVVVIAAITFLATAITQIAGALKALGLVPVK